VRADQSVDYKEAATKSVGLARLDSDMKALRFHEPIAKSRSQLSVTRAEVSPRPPCARLPSGVVAKKKPPARVAQVTGKQSHKCNAELTPLSLSDEALRDYSGWYQQNTNNKKGSSIMYVTKLVRNVLVVAALSCGTDAVLANNITGPSSSQSPYLLRAQPGVVTVSVLSVGDSVNSKPDGITPYRMVGIPDGLGAYDNGDGTFTVAMNHEIGGTISGGVITPLGVLRAHGNAGAFVSRWTIDKATLQVLEVQDFLPNATSIFLSNNKS
jgi:hypothetical protein